MAGGNKLLIYLLRRDLRVSDNPILHHLSVTKDHGFTHLLPIFVFPAHQVEVSGFLKDGQKSPYPPAVSQVGGFWRCGPHRAKFLAQSVWDLKNSLETLNSGLILRVGSVGDVLKETISGLQGKIDVGGVWMTEEVSYEEKQEHKTIKSICAQSGVDFRLWGDEKYFVDEYVPHASYIFENLLIFCLPVATPVSQVRQTFPTFLPVTARHKSP